MRPLGWYLDKIAQGEAITVSSFNASLKNSGNRFSVIQGVIELPKMKRGVAVILDQERFGNLLSHFGGGTDRTSRETAAVGGSSHRVNVDGSYLLIRSQKKPHPEVVEFKQGQVSVPRVLAKQCLVLENLQNFLHFNRTLAFLDVNTGADLSNCEIIWGAGNGISNKLHVDFLHSFQRINWLVDADLGGAAILYNSIRSLPDIEHDILYPSNFSERLISSDGSPLSAEARTKMVGYIDKMPILKDFLQPIIKLERQLEQETYLVGIE